jgi:Domain of unknown function (DUF3854)
MNPALALLVSRVYDGALAPEHRADLEKSGLTPETIEGHYIRSVPPAMIDTLLGFDVAEIRSALLFPFRSPAGGFMDHVFVKRFPAGRDRHGHTVKYLTRRGAWPRLYFTQPHRATVCDSDRPVWLVEGLKQSLAVAQLGLPTVGFMGIEGWHVAGTTDLCSDFDHLPLRGRIVELVPDGDWQTNRDVERGVRRLGTALCARGARPRIVVLPDRLEAPS